LSQQNALNKTYIDAHTEGFSEALNTAQTAAALSSRLRAMQLNVEDLHSFYQWFASHEKTMSLYSQGINQSSSGTDKVNAIINCHLATGRIGKPAWGHSL